MEQRLDATYLRPGLSERTIALGICAACVGTGIFLAAWASLSCGATRLLK